MSPSPQLTACCVGLGEEVNDDDTNGPRLMPCTRDMEHFDELALIIGGALNLFATLVRAAQEAGQRKRPGGRKRPGPSARRIIPAKRRRRADPR